jgi:diguanylate cyclase (GGDEF)-like protein/PAS domain S-box-containing protein
LPSIQEEQEMRDGRWVRYDDRRLSDGSTIGVRVDITDLKRREESFRLLFDENPVPMLLFQAGTLRITAVNDAAVSHYSFPRETFLSMCAPDLHIPQEAERAGQTYLSNAPSDEASTIWRHRLAGGGEIFVLIYRRAVTWTGQTSTLMVIVDVTERMRAEARIAHLAHHDALTGVANRNRFHHALREALSRRTSDRRLTLFLLDLDSFKPVNDTYGHAAGDAVLKLVAGRLRSVARGSDTVARLGGDEFALIHHAGAADVAALADRLVALMRTPFQVGADHVTIGVSIGVAFGDDDADADGILARADAALYAAKAAGKNTWRVHGALGVREAEPDGFS